MDLVQCVTECVTNMTQPGHLMCTAWPHGAAMWNSEGQRGETVSAMT